MFQNPIANINQTEPIGIDAKQAEVRYGDVLFTTSSETRDEAGMSSVWLNNRRNVYLNSFCFGYRPPADYNPYFLAFMLRSPRVREKFTLLAQGISRFNISKNKAMEMPVNLPGAEEQEKIGRMLQTLDEIIALRKRKVDALATVSQALLQQLYPRRGHNEPKMRFQGYGGYWHSELLGDLLDYEQPTKYIVESTEYDGSFEPPVLTTGQTFILGYTDETEGIKDASPANPIIIFDDFTTGSHFVTFPFKVKSSAMKLLYARGNVDTRFAFGALKNINYSPENHERHWISKFANFEVEVPEAFEQHKIGEILKIVSSLTANEELRLSELGELKESLLRSLFV